MSAAVVPAVDPEPLTYAKEQQRSAALANCLRRMADVVSSMPEMENARLVIFDEARQVEEGRFTIVVLGAFNRGKSTLLNAMIGCEVLPMAAVPSTAIITLLHYHPDEQIVVHYKDKSVSEPLTIDEFKKQYVLPVVEQIDAKVAEIDPSEERDDEEKERLRMKAARDIFSNIDFARVGFPYNLCHHGVEFVDSPGFEDDDARTKRALDFLDKSHAVVFLLDATNPVTDNDIKNLDWILSRGRRAIFSVINKWNILEIMEKTPAGRAKVEQRFRARLAKYVGTGPDAYESRVFKVNAQGAFEARTSEANNQAELDKSNFPSFERVLEKFLLEGRIAARDSALVSKATHFANDLDEAVERGIRLRQCGLEELIVKREALAPKLDQLRGVRRHIEAFLDGRTVAVQKMLVTSLNSHMANVDVHDIVYQRLDLSVITDTWLALRGLWDQVKSGYQWLGHAVGLVEKDKNRFFEAKVRNSLESQLKAIIEQEVKKWESGVAVEKMKTETQKLIEYLREEATDYQRILAEIAEVFHEEERENMNVEEIVKDWLKTATSKSSARTQNLDPTGLMIDLAPMVGAIGIELAMHLKGFAIPIVGTIIALILSYWRQKRTVEHIKQGIVEGLKNSLNHIPDAAGKQLMDEDVEKNFAGLKAAITTNISIKIASLQISLDEAISDVEKGNVNIEEERSRLGELRNCVRAELAFLEATCRVC